VQHVVLRSPHLDFWVAVRIIEKGGRWVVVADIAGDPEIGWGRSMEQAVRVALAGLGQQATELLLAGSGG